MLKYAVKSLNLCLHATEIANENLSTNHPYYIMGSIFKCSHRRFPQFSPRIDIIFQINAIRKMCETCVNIYK